jgi:hypothetical protein
MVAAGAFLALALVAPQTAAADGPRTPYVVAHGKSLYGVPWRIRMGEEPSSGKGQRRYVTLGFSIGRPSERNEAGHFSSFPLLIFRAFVLDATSGSQIDSFPEADTSGFVSRRAVKLVATMSEGPPLTFETQLRFFDQFYAEGIEPTELSAYDRAGRLLGRQPR